MPRKSAPVRAHSKSTKKKTSKRSPRKRKGSEEAPLLPVVRDYRETDDPEGVLEEVKAVLSDPLDLRTDAEIANEFGINGKILKSLQRHPDVRGRALKNLQAAMPDMTVRTVKAIQRGIENGSISAAKLMLELSGSVKSGDTFNFITNSTGGGVDASPVAAYSNEELASSIQTLLTGTYPHDVGFTPEGGVFVQPPAPEEVYPGAVDEADITNAKWEESPPPEAGKSEASQ